MRILKNILTLAMLLFVSSLSAQLSISLQGGEAAVGQTLEVDIIADQFTDLTTMQFNVVWDTLVMRFVEVKNVTSDLPGYALGGMNFGLPGTGSIKDGKVSTSWSDVTMAQSIAAANTRLFTIVLTAVGAECSTSSMSFENTEAADPNFQEVIVTASNGEIKVSGADCGGGGGGDGPCEGTTDVVLAIPSALSPNGSNYCFPISVANFDAIESLQSGIIWDPAVMTYTGIQNIVLLPTIIVNANDADQGELRLFWTHELPEQPAPTLDDGTIIAELCFDIIGADGAMTDISFGSIGNFNPEVGQGGGTAPLCIDNGKLTVGALASPDFELIGSHKTAAQGEEVCIAVSAREFNNLRGVQFNMTWDGGVIEYVRTQNHNGEINVTSSNF